jgi:ADP-heptose:LPS heptosyltransferase
LRATPYDFAIDFQGLWKSAAIAWASHAQHRVGFGPACLREPGAAMLYTMQVTPAPGQHVIAANLALVERLGVRAERWQFPLPRTAVDDAYVETALGDLPTRRFVIVNPGGGWRAKCWAPENYAQLIRRIEGELGMPALLTGSPQECPLIFGILDQAGAKRSRYFPATLVQFLALARRAALFISGDTGPLHLAAAVGTPIVGIFGPTDPARNGPFARDDIGLSNQGPINHTRRAVNASYISDVPVDAVLAAVRQRLERVHE